MKRLLLVAAAALTVVGAAQADTFVVVGSSSAPVPSAAEAAPVAFTLFAPAPVAAAAPQPATPDLRALWTGAGAAYGIPWQVLAAINKIESNFGRNMGPSSAGAVGWMQFMPDTWARWGVDADGNGTADPWNAADAIYSAARYLAAAGGTTDLYRGIFAYNHADWYVKEVLALASLYAQGGPDAAPQFSQGESDVVFTLDRMQLAVDSARTRVAEASSRLVAAQAAAHALERKETRALRRADRAPVLSDALELRKHAVQIGVRRVAADARVRALAHVVAAAQGTLRKARDRTQQASFAPAAAQLLSAPSYSGQYVFPVGGGPATVSVSHFHHDYPAADIAAPEGAPVYALANARVVRSYTDANGRCGIGATITTDDGQSWTYCHLSYLDGGVAAGATLAAGAPIGLVGHTGHATGPHLHLQLNPTDKYPQSEPWFRAFAGSAFRWQDEAAGDPVAAPSSPAPAPAIATDAAIPFSAVTR